MAIETTEKYCPICGKEVTEPAHKRFGEWACSEAHAEEYVKDIRAQRVSAVARASREAGQPPRQTCCGG